MASQEPKLPILMYHKVAPVDSKSKVPGHYVSPGLFARQMRILKLFGFQSVGLDTVYAAGFELPKKPIGITFDDGYQNFADNAHPILERFGYAATVFLVSNQMGGANEWDVKEGDVRESLMDVPTISRCMATGTQFGSHTADHADLTAVSEAEAWRQIAASKESLEQSLSTTVSTFCYPYGRKTVATMELVRKAGYRLACSTEKGTNTSQTDRYALRRINVRSDTWSPVFLLKLIRSARNGS